MNWLKQILDKPLARAGYQLHRFNRDQIVPPEISDPALYTGPEDFSRLFRPWLDREYDRWFTPEVMQNTMLSRKKLYWLLKLLRLLRRHGSPGGLIWAWTFARYLSTHDNA